jgi:hypothetical protein
MMVLHPSLILLHGCALIIHVVLSFGLVNIMILALLHYNDVLDIQKHVRCGELRLPLYYTPDSASENASKMPRGAISTSRLPVWHVCINLVVCLMDPVFPADVEQILCKDCDLRLLV